MTDDERKEIATLAETVGKARDRMMAAMAFNTAGLTADNLAAARAELAVAETEWMEADAALRRTQRRIAEGY